MERAKTPGNGADPANWKSCALGEGGTYVSEEIVEPDDNPFITYRDLMIGTPGEPNSP